MQSYLAARLKLTADQQAKMKEIWETTMRDGMRQHDEKRKALRKDRDDEIVGLIAPERKSEYDAVLQRYSDGQDALEKSMRDNFDAAVKQTNEILNPEQQADYNKFREERQRRQPTDGGRPGEGGRDGGPGGPRGWHDRDERTPFETTRPAAPSATTRPS